MILTPFKCELFLVTTSLLLLSVLNELVAFEILGLDETSHVSIGLLLAYAREEAAL